MKSKIALLVVSIMLLLSFTVMTTQARGAQAPRTAGGIEPITSPVASIESVAATYQYWTAEKMAAAIPMDRGPDSGTAGGVSPAAAAPIGQGGAAPGSAPGEPSKPAITLEQAGIQPTAQIFNYYTYPYPYTWSGMGAFWPSTYPLRTNAKMYLTINGGNYVCSATVVTDGGSGFNRLVATAGHCVHAGDNSGSSWAYNVLICPAYRTGVGPWGCWAGVLDGTLSPWYSSADWRFDHGFVLTAKTNSLGYGNIATITGTNGLAWNYPYQQDIWSFGYPAASPYTGELLIWTTSGVASIDDPGYGAAPYPFGVGSDETGGSSGGAWAIGMRLAVPGYVVSHNDYKYTSPAMPLAMFGPYQDTNWYNLWNYMRGLNP